jgi:hypothetical protein
MPGIVATLIDPLSKTGYRAIALEVPHDEQAATEAWATGKSDAIPKFFSQPGPDGRGNREVLAMIRLALGPPYAWKLICFDETEADLMRQVKERLPQNATKSLVESAAALSPADMAAISNQRDASMAQMLAEARKSLRPEDKVLAICGSLHARTTNRAPPENPMAALWQSFAATFMQDEPRARVQSVNVQAFGGEYFNGGKIQTFSKRPLEQTEMRRTQDAEWDAELNIPTATVATFLRPAGG